MALNIKNVETEKLAAEVAEMAGESKTGAVTQGTEGTARTAATRGAGDPASGRSATCTKWLETEIWPQIPA